MLIKNPSLQFLKDLYVRWAKIILWDFCNGNPLDVVMFQFLRNTSCNRRIEKAQPDSDIRVFMDYFHVKIPNRKRDSEFLLAFPNQRLLLCFTGFNLSAYKLPILTDNGSEFKHTREMEFTVDGQRRTRIYYCDPQASWQKPHVEKNHEYIRYVLPRGKSFSPYTQEDIILLLNHINSTRRSKLGGKTPFELADGEEFLKLKEVMGLKAIPADEVDLTPRLLRKK